MATAHITLGQTNGRSLTGSTVPAPRLKARISAPIETTAVSQVVPGLVAEGGETYFVTVDVDCYVNGGVAASNPVAGPAAGFKIKPGSCWPFVAEAGEVLAIREV